MEQLKCSICKNIYDLQDKLPRLFPCCGHSFCSSCIQLLVETSPNEVKCPEDGKIEEFYDRDRGIESFPLNFALKNILEKYTKQQEQRQKQQEEEEQNQEKQKEEEKKEIIEEQQIQLELEQKKQNDQKKYQICEEHNKKCELVCLTDQVIICSDCVLFGKHKSHQFYKMNDFKKMVKQKIIELENSLEQTKKQGPNIFQSENQLMDYLGDKVEKAKQLQILKLQNSFENVKKKIVEKQHEFDKMVNTNFEKFIQGIELAAQNSENLRKKQIKINSDVAEIKAQIKNNYPNFQFILQNIHSEKNLVIIQKQLREDFIQHQKNLDKMLVQQIEKIDLQIDLKKIFQDIQDIVIISKQQNEIPQQDNQRQNFQEEDNRETRIGNQTLQTSQNSNNVLQELQNSSSSNENIFEDSDNSLSQDLIKQQDSMNSNSLSPQKTKQRKFIKQSSESQLKKNQSFLKKQKTEEAQQNFNINYKGITNPYQQEYQQPGPFLYNQQYPQNTQIPQQRVNPELVQSAYYNNDPSYQQSRIHPDQMNSFYYQGQQPQYKHTIGGGQRNFHPKFSQQKRTINQQQQNLYQSYNQDQSQFQDTRMKQPTSIRQPQFLPPNSKEGQLNFKKQKINDTGLIQVLKKIQNFPNLKVVNLSENILTSEGLDYLLKNLQNHPTLEKLHLRSNFIDDKGIEVLRKYQNKIKKLKYINLKGNKIKDSKLNEKILSTLASKGFTIIIN